MKGGHFAQRPCIADVRWLYNIARSAVQPANMGEGFCKKPEPAMQCYVPYDAGRLSLYAVHTETSKAVKNGDEIDD